MESPRLNEEISMLDTKTAAAVLCAAVLGLAACSSPAPRSAESDPGAYPSAGGSPRPADVQTARYGYVESVEALGSSASSGPGIGAIGGAVLGGVLGNQVGHGTGRAAATVGGAVLGGVAGHKVEEAVRARSGSGYRFRVRLDDGTYQTFTQEQHDNLRVGDRVRIENGRVWPS
jgi:outer membrane lipoprotein SlyB